MSATVPPPREFGAVAKALTSPVGTASTLEEIVLQATRLVPSRWAAALVADRITATQAPLAATTDASVTNVIAEVAGACGDSPGWHAFDHGVMCDVPDLAAETRFGDYPHELLARTPVRSVLSLPLLGADRVVGVMTLYGDRADAFDDEATARAILLSTHAGVAIAKARATDKVDNLEVALATSRTIGAAVGILVERHRLSEDAAFEVLRTSSQLTNRKVLEISRDLVSTGALPEAARALARLHLPVDGAARASGVLDDDGGDR